MEIKSIDISRNEYGADKGRFTARISLKGGSSYPADINIGIPDEALQPIVNIIQQAVVESMARSAQEFADSVALSLEHKKADAVIEHKPEEVDDEPF